MPYFSPEDMLAACAEKYRVRTFTSNSTSVGPGLLSTPAALQHAPVLQETSQTPRQWNLTTLKRCIVTRAEYQYWGSVELVLERKGFPTRAPDDGSILLSWFDQESGCAFYELARVQDPGELMSYMLEHFQPQPAQEGGRLIQFPDEPEKEEKDGV